MSPNRLYIIAGTKYEYDQFCRKSIAENRFPDTDFVYVSGFESFKGQINPNGICIGTWKDRLDITDILFQLQVACKDKDKFCRAVGLAYLVSKHKNAVQFGSPNGA